MKPSLRKTMNDGRVRNERNELFIFNYRRTTYYSLLFYMGVERNDINARNIIARKNQKLRMNYFRFVGQKLECGTLYLILLFLMINLLPIISRIILFNSTATIQHSLLVCIYGLEAQLIFLLFITRRAVILPIETHSTVNTLKSLQRICM